ncbi:MAG: hypothetical protein ACRBBN_15290 [Methyloligellaceae bacterium]
MNDILRENIIELVSNLNTRARHCCYLSSILTTMFDKKYNDLMDWSSDCQAKNDFLVDYQISFLRCLAMELCVILDSVDTNKKQYSVDALLIEIRKYIYNSVENKESLFSRPEEIKSGAEFRGFIYITEENIPENSDDKSICKILDKEKKSFLTSYGNELTDLKKTRNEFLAHPDINGNGKLPYPDFLRRISDWCFSYSNLILNLVTESGVPSYTIEGKKHYQEEWEKKYSSIIDIIIGSRKESTP